MCGVTLYRYFSDYARIALGVLSDRTRIELCLLSDRARWLHFERLLLIETLFQCLGMLLQLNGSADTSR